MKRLTVCEECQRVLLLVVQDGTDPLDLIGGECACGYYVTRYNDEAAAQKAGLL